MDALKKIIHFGILLFCFAILLILFSPPSSNAVVKQSTSNNTCNTPQTTINQEPGVSIENKIIYPKTTGDYVFVRYVKLQGTNYEIGKALGDIAQEEYGVALTKYDDATYGEERKNYMANHFPILLERMKGVADSYQQDYNNNIYDYGGLPIDVYLPLCSAFYIPPADTDNGHAKVARNLDFSATTKSEQLQKPLTIGEPKMLSNILVTEVHPSDGGYAYISLGGFDVLNPMSEGVNSNGLYIGIFGNVGSDDLTMNAYGSKNTGISISQMVNLIMSECATLEEARSKLESNQIYVPIFDVHVLAADQYGNTFVWDRDTNEPAHFTYNNGQPQVITNHPVSEGYDTSTFPVDPSYPSYGSVVRYDALSSMIANHSGKFSDQDMWDIIASVYPKGSSFGTHGYIAKNPIPFRPIWSSVWDLNDRSIQVKYYLHDINKGNDTEPDLVLTEIYTFKLKD